MTTRRLLLWCLGLVVALPLLGQAASVATQERGASWSTRRWDSAGLAPDPAVVRDAVIQAYAARVWGWRGVFAVHSWVVVKPEGAPAFTRYEVIGWGDEVVRISNGGRPPDGYWAGNQPEKLLDVRGAEAARLIPEIEKAVADYPGRERYIMWPGPNSNSFVAHIGRAVPDLRLNLPPTAIGKDFLVDSFLVGSAPSGTGLQLSLFGLAGVTLAATEGIELNLLGLTIGVDIARPALKLPGIGRLGVAIVDE
jgi:hypothetical protein